MSVLEFKGLISENSIKCNRKNFKYSIQQVCCRRSSYAVILAIDILVQTMSIASNALQKFIQIALKKMKTAYCAIFKL